jgi:hypothetical protein
MYYFLLGVVGAHISSGVAHSPEAEELLGLRPKPPQGLSCPPRSRESLQDKVARWAAMKLEGITAEKYSRRLCEQNNSPKD